MSKKSKMFTFPIEQARCGDILLQDQKTGSIDWWSPDPNAIRIKNSFYKLHYKDTVEAPNHDGLSTFFPVKDFLEIAKDIEKLASKK